MSRPNRSGILVAYGTLLFFSLSFLSRAGIEGQNVVESTLLIEIQETIEAGNLDQASQQIAAALRHHATDAGLLNLRGVIHARRNEFDLARDDFSEAVRLAPTLLPAWKNLARVCQIERVSDCAIKAWERVLRSSADDSEAHAGLAVLYQEQKRYQSSLSHLDALPPPDQDSTENTALRVVDLCGIGNVSGARTVAAKLGGNPQFSARDFDGLENLCAPAVIELARALDLRNTAGLRTLQRLVIAYEQTGDNQRARAVLERVALADSKNPAHLIELARLAESAHDYEGALGYLAHARDLEPNNARIEFLWGVVADEMDLPLEANKSLGRALALDPSNVDYNYAMGATLLKTRDRASAVPYFQKVAAARPRDARAEYALGVAYFAAGEYDNAKREMEKLKRDRNAAPGASYFLGRIARLEGDQATAINDLRLAEKLLPAFAEPHIELGRLLLEENKIEDARAELQIALKLDPGNFQANAQLLALYKRTHDSRQQGQAEILSKLDEERSRQAELMLRTIEVRR